MNTHSSPQRNTEKGQSLILVAVAFVVLLAFVGLVTDVGQLFISMGNLRRAADAASLAAAAQFREGRSLAEMTSAAVQVMHLNGIDPGSYTVDVKTCDNAPGDPSLCTTPRRKLVRVEGEVAVPMTFLSLIGVRDIKINAASVGEAASLDVVLVIDISDSMTWDAPEGDPMRDPHACNLADPSGTDGFPGECQPFEEVKKAASSFINRVLNKPPSVEEDRLAIITFANGWSSSANLGTHYRTSGWTNDGGEAQAIVRNLSVFDPPRCYEPGYDDDGHINADYSYGPCRYYDTSNRYQWLDCLSCWQADPPDGEWSSFQTTNIGGGLLRAGNMFALEPREEALWVVVLLTDGMANATDTAPGDNLANFSTYPIGYCPGNIDTFPLCQDHNVATRHSSGSPYYDADDYARDMADFVACPPINTPEACNGVVGQGALIFTIGLGNTVLDSTNEAHGRPYGASLLRYIANVGYDGDPDPSKDPCKNVTDYKEWCGNYYFAPEGPQLSKIFEDIASRIFTRLVH